MHQNCGGTHLQPRMRLFVTRGRHSGRVTEHIRKWAKVVIPKLSQQRPVSKRDRNGLREVSPDLEMKRVSWDILHRQFLADMKDPAISANELGKNMRHFSRTVRKVMEEKGIALVRNLGCTGDCGSCMRIDKVCVGWGVCTGVA